MKELRKLAFVVEEFATRTPAQQLVDRFLIGYPRGGTFHRLENCRVSVFLGTDGENAELRRREQDFGLVTQRDLRETLAEASGVVIVCRGSGEKPNERLVKEVLDHAPRGAACFIHGALSSGLDGAKEIGKRATSKGVLLLAGTPLGVTWRLPAADLPRGTSVKESLIVVQGASPVAEWDGLEGLLPVIESRKGGEAGVRSIQLFKGEDLWRASAEGKWSWPLLAAALSRSDTPQGDPVKDGRTQDLAGLGLVPKLAREPRGWVVEHRDGVRSAILVLDGVIADYNFAVQTGDGSVISAQIYRPPPPAEDHFSRLAEVMEDFFRTGQRPWRVERSILIAGLLEAFGNKSAQSGQPTATPELDIAYSV